MMVAMESTDRARAEERLRVLELLETAMERRDEVFAIVDSSDDTDEAEERLR
jgi:DNA gyrase/topoisomerase IV subunit A